MDLLFGIDTVAHKNSMKNVGKTIAVIASGFNYIFPKENIELANEIVKNGGLIISEYPPNTEIDMKKFPARNRIIAGISNATIVIEAKAVSGSGITARNAIEQGKLVFCIPQDIGKKTGVGTNNLIKKGAKLVTSSNEILEQIGESKIEEVKDDMQKNKNIKYIDKKYTKIYNYISKNSVDINKISRDLNINIAELNQKLTLMEIEELIEFLPGNIIKVKS